jgi:DNA invertase Pin-like site-specific DNA recombinase
MSNLASFAARFDMMAQKGKFVAYIRVSTAKQGKSGLGLEDQRDSVRKYVAEVGGKIIAPEFKEVESGKRNDRPELEKALKRCRLTGATLVVAKLDRLSRNAAFLLTLRDSGVKFVAVDLRDANTLTVGVMATVAQYERELISKRTKDALAVARKRGVALGGYREKSPNIARFQKKAVQAVREGADARAEEWRDTIEGLQAEGLSLNAMAARLNKDGLPTSRGGAWTATTVRRVMARL